MAKNELIRLSVSGGANREGDSHKGKSCCSVKVVKCCVLLFNSVLLVSVLSDRVKL